MRGAMPLPSPASCAVRGAARPCLRRAVCPFASALQTSPYREPRGCPPDARPAPPAAAVGLAGAAVLVVCCASALGRGAGGSSALLQQLWGGGLWASLDNSVPLKAAAREVDIGGSVVRTHLARRARPVPGQIDGGQFLSDTVRQDPHHLGIYGGMYWGQDTAPKPEARARGLVRQGDKWLRAPARGQRGAGGKASDAQVGGIIKALEQQKSPPPPEWWVRKREEWLQKQHVAAAKKALTKHLIRINPDFTGTPMDAKRDALYARGPALSGLRSIPSHKEQRGAHGRHATPKRRSARAAAPAHAHASPDIVILPGKHLVHPHR